MSTKGSNIFIPNRMLGYVSNHIPLRVRYIQSRKENLIVTCVGKSFHTYGISHFGLLSVSDLHPEDITSMSSDAYHVYTASGNLIYAWRRGTEIKHTYKGHENDVHLLMPFGAHLLSVDEESVVKIWDIKTEELFLELSFNNNDFKVTAILHPSTYINKVLFASEQGQLQLWNIKKSKQIYVFKGWGAAVSCLEQAPAVNVVAIGLVNGKIILHNLKFDETIMEFSQDWGLVTSISFRTDGNSIMATGSLLGHVTFWNLDERQVASQLMLAHNGSVTGMYCLPGEPLIVTSSPDNTLKLWIFDMPDGGARLLRIREGHGAPPNRINFHGANGQNILSAGSDSTLRIFNTVTEIFNKSLGKASYNRKLSKKRGRLEKDPLIMPPIIDFTSEISREKEWDNIAAIHLGLPIVTTWSYDKLKMGELKLLPDRFKKKNRDLDVKISATCLCMTHCGNFVIIGYNTGHVDRFNIQSGQYRATYGSPVAHRGPVRGVASDMLNKIVVTGGNDAAVKFWHFKETGPTQLIQVLEMDDSVCFFRHHIENGLLAVALVDYSIAIVDCDTRNTVRKFNGHAASLTDAAFSNNGRWLMTSGMDCVIKTWDLPTATLVDHFKVDTPCTSMSFSPTGELLATTHVDSLGIYLWVNRTLYSHVSLRAIAEDSEIPLVALPGVSKEHCEEIVDDEITDEPKQSNQLNPSLVTLSGMASSRWQNLLNIDIVKQRNKPKSAPQAPKSAPFFLPTVPALNLQFDLSENTQTGKLLMPKNFSNLSRFGQILEETESTSDFEPAIEILKTYGPTTIDFEIKNLSPEVGGTIKAMLQFFKMIEYMLASNNDFELAQSYLSVFLKSHGALIAKDKQLSNNLAQIQHYQHAGWNRLQEKLFYSLTVVESLKNL